MQQFGWATRALVVVAIASIVGLTGVSGASAATTRTWVGPDHGRWSVAANWTPAGVPANGDSLVLAGDVQTIDDIATLTIADLTKTGSGWASFDNPSGVATQLTITGAISATGTLVVDHPITLSAGNHVITTNEQTVIHASGPGGITKLGAGRLDAEGTFSGAIFVTAGSIDLSRAGLPGASTTVAAGATVQLSGRPGTTTADENVVVSGDGAPGRVAALELNAVVQGHVTLAGPASIGKANPGNWGQLKGGISGTGPLRVTGTGVDLMAAGTYSAGTDIEAPVFVTASDALGTGAVHIDDLGAVTLDNGVSLSNAIDVDVSATNRSNAISAFKDAALLGPVTFVKQGAVPLDGGRRIGAFPDVTLYVDQPLRGDAPVHVANGDGGVLALGGTGASSLSGTMYIDGGIVTSVPSTGTTAALPAHLVVGTDGLLDLAGSNATVQSLTVDGELYLGTVAGDTPDISTLTTESFAMRPLSALGVVVGGTTPGTDTDRIVASSVSIDDSYLLVDLQGAPPLATLRIIDNTGSGGIGKQFRDPATDEAIGEGTPFEIGSEYFRASYAGGTGNDFTLTSVWVPPPPTPPPPPAGPGYWMIGRTGEVYAFGGVPYKGGAGSLKDIVDLEPSRSGNGYWIATAGGFVTGFGDAYTHGNALGKLRAGESVVSISTTPDDTGYWLFTNRGRVLAFGSAPFLGDMSAATLNGPVLSSVATPSGRGYYMVASDGGVFSFGDARFYGSMGGKRLNAPVASLVPDADNVGYWMVASDGGVFAFDASFRGSMGGTRLNRPVIGMVRNGSGYLMVGEDGGIFNFSDQPFFGSLGGVPLPAPIVAVGVHG